MDNTTVSSDPIVRLTIDQLADLVDRLSVRNRTLDDKSRWNWSPIASKGLSGLGATQVLPVNYYRRGLLFSANGGVVFIGTDQSVASSNGISLGQAGIITQEFTYDLWGAGVCQNWWAFTASPATALSWLELMAPIQV